MNSQELNKRKGDLLKSIMSHPKLSKNFRDALSSPIGSSKRQQTKAIVSIMKKLSGTSDGQGGPNTNYGGMQMSPMPYASSVVPNYAQDYSNMMIFPAAPKFKVKATGGNSNGVQNGSRSDGQGGPGDFSTLNIDPNNIFSAKPSSQLSSILGNTSLSNLPSPSTNAAPAINTPNSSVLSTSGIPKTATPASYGNLMGSLSLDNFNTKPVVPSGLTGEVPATSGITMDWNKYIYPSGIPGSTAPSTQTATTPTTPIKTTPTPTPGTTSGAVSGSSTTTEMPQKPLSEEDILRNAAAAAVKSQTGAATFALGETNKKFGGGLSDYLDTIDKHLKETLNLTGLETQLSDLKAKKDNIVPTLTSYIQGRDKYLSFVDGLIDQANADLLKKDMANPAVANTETNYMNYLYTLKGRQNQRYGQFLNTAINEYNTDVENLQTHYDNVSKQYQDAMTRQSTIAQNDYNTLYASLSDLYNNLDQAPQKALQNELLREQLLNAQLQNLAIVKGGASSAYLKEQSQYNDKLIDKKTGALLPGDVVNLAGIYGVIAANGLNPAGVTDLVAQGIATGLNATSGDPAKGLGVAKDYRNMINSLALDPTYGSYASQIAPVLAKAGSKVLSEYVLKNASDVKNALTGLVSGGWFGKAGINDKSGWVKKYEGSVDKNVLNDIYDSTMAAMNTGSSYKSNPQLLFTSVLDPATGESSFKKKISDMTDSEIASIISNRIGSMWAAEPSNVQAGAAALNQ